MQIKFKNIQHKEFFLKMQRELEVWDVYHKALFYCLGMSADCREHITDIVTWDSQAHINTDVFESAWLTSSSKRCIEFGYNLFNGFQTEETDPYNLYADSDAPYYQEAVKVRYPEYLEEKESYCIMDEQGHVFAENIPQFLVNSYISAFTKQHGGTYTAEPQKAVILDI